MPARLAGLMVGSSAYLMTAGRGSFNAKAKRELGWAPEYPTCREGFRTGLSS